MRVQGVSSPGHAFVMRERGFQEDSSPAKGVIEAWSTSKKVRVGYRESQVQVQLRPLYKKKVWQTTFIIREKDRLVQRELLKQH